MCRAAVCQPQGLHTRGGSDVDLCRMVSALVRGAGEAAEVACARSGDNQL